MSDDERKLLLVLARIQLKGYRQRDQADLVELIARVETDSVRAADEECHLGRG